MDIFDPKKLAEKWNARWRKAGVYQPELVASSEWQVERGGRGVQATSYMLQASDTYYNLMMFPYPSAEGLHVGNMYAFTGSDIWGRYQRMQGKTVFEPIGLDGFGIHSENYAIKVGRHPKEHAKVTEENFYRQLSEIGNGFAWENRLETYDPEYYRWTQWIFVQLFKAGLAYRKKAPVNWCPSCKTVLADEQVIDGLCERCSSAVEKRDLEQWFFKITDYADRLLDNLTKIDWDNKVKVAQKNWIGKKEGVHIDHKVKDSDITLTAFSAYPAWLFADTFLVLAPDHPQVQELVKGTEHENSVQEFVAKMREARKENPGAELEKQGIFTGRFVIDPFTGEEMPVWLANFALMDFGTGIIRCSAHDPRDYEFAHKYDLKLREVVDRVDEDNPVHAHENKGVLRDSGPFSGRSIDAKLIEEMLDWIEEKGIGKRTVTYHLRDWLISRQRYWGPPIPMIFCEKCAREGKSWFTVQKTQRTQRASESDNQIIRDSDTPNFRLSEYSEFSESMAGWYPVPEEELPVVLPELEDFKPTGDGKAPLERAPKEWLEVKCPECGKPARRETDVSDTFLDSAWYFLRYPSINKNSKSQILNPKQISSSKLQNPKNLEFRNLSLEFPWDKDVTLRWLPVDMYIGGAEHSVLHLLYARFVTMFFYDQKLLQFEEPFTTFRAHGLIIKDGAKMSKSKGNVVNPDEYIAKFGADTLRTYLMFVGPLRDGGDFRDTGIAGMYRFLERFWNTYSENSENNVQKTQNTQNARGSDKSESQKVRNSDTLDLRFSDVSDSPSFPSVLKLKYIGEETSPTLKRKLHWAIKRATEGIERLKYNTAIAAVMELLNLWRGSIEELQNSRTPKLKTNQLSIEDAGLVLRLMALFAPYLTEELFEHLRKFETLNSKFETNTKSEIQNSKQLQATSYKLQAEFSRENSIHVQEWPTWEESLLKEEVVAIVVQVNGKVRSTLRVEQSAVSSQQSEQMVTKMATEDMKVKPWIEGKEIKRVVWVPGKVINLVTG